MTLHPHAIEGPWKAGIVLDWHTVESKLAGEDEYGHPKFDTIRTDVGELLYQFKYRGNHEALEELLTLAINRLSKAKGRIDLVVPVPPSNPTRTTTRQIAYGLASGLATAASDTALTKTRATDELKSVKDPARRREMLAGVFSAQASQMLGRSILLVDDLYRSGATLEAATEAAYT